MSDYVLEGEKWGGSAFGSTGGTVSWAVDNSIPTAFVAQIVAAFADWSRYGNITFTQVSSTSSSQIDFSDAYIDGLNNVLGETSFSYIGSRLQSAQITFDSGEGWHVSGSSLVSNAGANFFIVALHEIGHAIGLDHYTGGLAVMNPYLTSSLANLTQSDIDGIRAIYGSSPQTTYVVSDVFGRFAHDAQGPWGKVFALYDALLGRAPDALGFEDLTHALQSGTSLHDLAQSMLASGEHTASFGRFDQLSDAAFIEQLYEVTQHRAADAPGLAHFESALAAGVSRADVAVSFALSDEHIGRLGSSYAAGVYDPDKDASDIARLYYGVQGRAPDADGLMHWRVAASTGESIHDIAQDFLASAEYRTKFGGLDDAHYVDTLYQNALGRHAEADGLHHFMSELQHGGSRVDVAFEIAESPEARQHLMPVIESGWVLA